MRFSTGEVAFHFPKVFLRIKYQVLPAPEAKRNPLEILLSTPRHCGEIGNNELTGILLDCPRSPKLLVLSRPQVKIFFFFFPSVSLTPRSYFLNINLMRKM